jgi:hypothetical protein
MNLAALRSRFPVPTLLTVTVLAGTADLITAQDRESVPAGEARRITAPDPAAAARATQLYQEVRKELPMPNDEAAMAAWKDQDGKLRDLSLLVLKQPAAMAAIRPAMVRDLADAKLGTETKARIIGMALLDEDKHTFAAVTQVWTSSIDAGNQQADRLFSFEEQVALTERGFALAAGKLKEFLREPAGTLAARAAAALAFGGDASARELLKPWNEVTVDAAIENFENLNARCQAAVGLAALGDRDAVPALRTFAHDLVEKLLEGKDQTAMAAWAVQRVSYYLASPRPRLGEVELRTDAVRDDAMLESPDAAKVRAALAKLAPK